MKRLGSLLRPGAGSARDVEHETLLGKKDSGRKHLPIYTKTMLSIVEGEAIEESENNFETYDVSRINRFMALEFIGTYCFTLIASGSAMSTGVLTYQFGMEEQTAGRIISVSFAQGLAYTAVMYTASSFLDNKLKRKNELLRTGDSSALKNKRESGEGSFRDYPCGYFNPAITFAMALTKTYDQKETQISPSMASTYICVQVTASICSTYTLSMLFNHLAIPNNPLGVPVMGDGATVVGALLMETMLTFSLTMAILILLIRGESLTDHTEEEVNHGGDGGQRKMRESRGYIRNMAPLAIGLIHVTLSLLGIPVSGASMNPARSFGTAIMSNIWTEHWLYWVGPFLGSGCAALVYGLIAKKL